jgi:hypothetical protein
LSAQAATKDVFQHQMRDGIDLQIKIAHSPSVTSDIFDSYTDTVLIPAIEANQELPGCAKKPASLFCDNCSAHIADSVVATRARHGILLRRCPAHTSHIFQIRDRSPFGLMKHSRKYQMRDDSLPSNVDHILGLSERTKVQWGL